MTKKENSPEPAEQKMVGITIRVDVETNRILSAILSLKGMTLSGLLQSSIKAFIQENYEEAKELFDISRIPGIPKEEGKKTRQKTNPPKF
jgi:hypothetical protein